MILGVFAAYSQDALFTLFGAATLLPAVIYAATVALYWPSGGRCRPGAGSISTNPTVNPTTNPTTNPARKVRS
ncbi:hypothetical protein ACFFX1_19910 [Dactylosporangium sucinum]|uniref:Uncharacterized protein n=1 Tax=Dactylosporangium sucinum TaxID=1424081 RepID=A0A917UGY1_9ACTN|nr:hypothetical protein [Dactylosporangium sucinum]GGM88440.1 hypothetical protein GCM10007977_108060 [Dactylosporangium sucinum]